MSRWCAGVRGLAALAAVALVAGKVPAQDPLLGEARRLVSERRYGEAADVYRRSLERVPDDTTVLAELTAALDAAGRWRDAMPYLERLVGLSAPDARRLTTLARFNAWSGNAVGATRLFDRALAADSMSASQLAAYGEFLSWRPATRERAESLLRRALALERDHREARIALAHLLAWTGRDAAAFALYEAVLREAPDDVSALRGRGILLAATGDLREAERTLQRVLTLAPDDADAARALAQVQVAGGRHREAARLLERHPAAGRGEGRFIADSVRRATGVRLEVAALARDRSRQLDAGGIGMSTSAPFGVARLGLSTMPVTFRDAAGSYSARRDGIDIQYGGPGRVQLVASGARWSVDRAGDAPWEGRLAAELAPAPRLSLLAEIARAVVQETRRSFPGPDDAALAPSGVHATTSRAGFATWWRALDLRASASIGRYEGAGLEPNERLGVDADAGLVVHSHAPWVRVGYAFRAQHFDYDAFDVSAGASRYGGYFSPDRHEVHLGVLQLSHRFGGALLLEFDGRLGGQQVRSVPGRLSDARVAVVTYTHAAWRLTRGLDLDVVFLHVDAFEAFRLNELRAGLRHTF